MSEPAWITRWQARDALKNGRPEEAHRLMDALVASGNRRAWGLRDEVVRGYVERGERSLRRDDAEAAWDDVLRAEGLSPDDAGATRLRETLTRLGLAEARALLENGKPLLAVEAIVRLKERSARSPEVAPLEETAQDWVLAQVMAERGDFALARQTLERVRRRLTGRTDGLDRFEQKLDQREERFAAGRARLHDSLAAADWRAVLATADEILAVAPRHREAQDARTRAWQAVQPETAVFGRPSGPAQAPEPGAADTSVPPKRFFLWLDGVGAYLVCLGSRVTLGQATAEGPIDVPLFADVHRIHASLTRDEECYMLESARGVRVNGRPVERGVLQSGDLLTLCPSCELLFDQPVPGCTSARLTPTGGRRLPMAVDGVLLMADMLVLGPGAQSHVCVPDLREPVYLFRQKDRLGVRWSGEFTLDGQRCRDRAILSGPAGVSGDDFAFALEPVTR